MKKTTLASKDGDLLEKLIAKYGKVVTARQIASEARHTWDYQQTHNRIQQLVKNGWLIRIKRGLYVISELSSRGFLSISPYVVSNLLVEESYVSFEAALAYHGMFDQFTDQFISVSLKQFKAVNLEPIYYRFIKTQPKLYTGWEAVTIENLPAKIAFAEKALVDLIHFRKNKYAVDLLIEKLQDHQADLEMTRLANFANLASIKTIKIFGLVFDLLGLNSDQFHQLIKGRRSTHHMRPEDKTFNAKWRLYYDSYFEKYRRN
ncbi:MAG: type IV toxin-antitoxin system AbiEi family antitoxin domain-containing protein [Chloroflexota bacterium]